MISYNRLFSVSVIILVLGFFIDQTYFVHRFFGGHSVFFSIPLFLVYLTYPSLSIDNFFNKTVLLYLSALTLLWIASGFSNFNKFYGLVGCTLLGWVLTSQSLGWYRLFIFIKIFAIATTISVISYYFGLWDIKDSGRSTFLRQQLNIMGNLLNIGYASLWFLKIHARQNKKKYKYLNIILILFALPVLATISRTGVFVFLGITIVFYFQNLKRTFLVYGLIGLMVGPFAYSIISKIEIIEKIEERSEEITTDPRIILANRALDYVIEHPFGGGFQLYDNFDAYADIGIFVDTYGTKEIVSIHNSFLDLAVFGGIPLSILYSLIILNILIVGIKYYFHADIRIKNIGAFLISGFLVIFLYSFTGQAFSQKFNWFCLGLNYALIYMGKLYLIELKHDLSEINSLEKMN